MLSLCAQLLSGRVALLPPDLDTRAVVLHRLGRDRLEYQPYMQVAIAAIAQARAARKTARTCTTNRS